ncbi:unnamed protein product [Candidula unifasciata]|uniref:Ectonucleotide pyrophosphatase/phosphodiesterase family member 5 n=1 Tax=Candidula unifasciata TaxID=100452 RepID=A0A8S3ZEC2_9EUPU|nr:unnamed protein product [Candidula unifasciata]
MLAIFVCLVFCLVLAFLLLASNVSISAEKTSSPPLLIISYDGFRWDYLNRTRTPNFDHIIKHGVYARRGLVNVFATSTLTNHWSMVTGLYPESHGIIDNHFFDPDVNKTYIPLYQNWSAVNDPRFYDTGAEPIWVTNQLQKENGRSGSVMWWGAENIVKNTRPTHHMPYNLTIESTYIIDTMVKWFTQDSGINLGLLYFSEPDHTAHQFGPDSDNVTQMIGKADELTGYLFRQLSRNDLLEDMNIIFTSDHGFASASKENLIYLDKYIDPSWYTVIHYTPVAAIMPKPGKEDIIFEKLKAASTDNHFTVYRKKDIPDRLRYRNNIRTPPIIIVADITYNFITNMSADQFKLAGNHGYDNKYEDMHPFFLAMGPSFKQGVEVETFQMVDLYPLMCRLLELQPAPNNGSLDVVSLFLQDQQNSIWTVSAYILSLAVIITLGGTFAVASVWHYCQKHKSSELGFGRTAARIHSFKDINAQYKLIPDEEAHDDGL